MAGGINKEAAAALLAQRKKQREEGGGGKKKFESDVQWFSLPSDPCEVEMRFLPPFPGQDIVGHGVKTHWKIPLTGQGNNKAPCLIDTLGPEKDPIELVLSKYRDQLNTEDYEASLKQYFNVLVISVKVNGRPVTMDEKKIPYNPKIPRVLGIYGDYTQHWLLEQVVDEKVGDVTDPIEGFVVQWKRTQSGGKWERKALPWRKADFDKPFGTAIGSSQEEVDQILSSMYDLSKIFKPADDQSYKKAVKAAAALEAHLEAELTKLRAAEATGLAAPAETAPVTADKAPADTKASAKAEVKKEEKATPKPATKIKAPTGAPTCFGDVGSLHAGFDSEEAADEAESLTKEQRAQLKACRGCAFESDCAAALGR